MKDLVKVKILDTWQRWWEGDNKGRWYNDTQRVVGTKYVGRIRSESRVVSRLRSDRTQFNYNLFKLGKYINGKCDFCYAEETTEHVLMNCGKFFVHSS